MVGYYEPSSWTGWADDSSAFVACLWPGSLPGRFRQAKRGYPLKCGKGMENHENSVKSRWYPGCTRWYPPTCVNQNARVGLIWFTTKRIQKGMSYSAPYMNFHYLDLFGSPAFRSRSCFRKSSSGGEHYWCHWLHAVQGGCIICFLRFMPFYQEAKTWQVICKEFDQRAEKMMQRLEILGACQLFPYISVCRTCSWTHKWSVFDWDMGSQDVAGFHCIQYNRIVVNKSWLLCTMLMLCWCSTAGSWCQTWQLAIGWLCSNSQ